MRSSARVRTCRKLCMGAVLVTALLASPVWAAGPLMDKNEAAAALAAYFETMCIPKPFPVLTGDALTARHRELRARILADAGLEPLPERVDLDAHRSEPIDHPWCAIQKIEYRLWPGVYTQALLFMPKEFPETPAPAMLCPHGHWDHNHAHPDVQTRLLTFARMGYVVLSPRQNHHEDLLLGLSHQTLMIWTNMRGIDFLQSLPEVDPERIGAAGASGGGLQTQMVTALDDRIKAATIVGLTCDYREILFPHAAHCACNHWPNLMAYTDSPEISALAFPRPVQYLVMNDWTRHFPHDNFPTILELFHQNGFPDRVSCTYWPTGHTYDRDKRERTYWWMERWLRNAGNHQTPIPAEPGDIVTVFPPQMLDEWPVKNPENKGFDALAALFHARYHHAKQPRPDPDGLKEYAVKMKAALPGLLGLENGLKPEANGVTVLSTEQAGEAIVSQVEFPSEGYLRLPARVFRPAEESSAPWPVTLCLSREGATGLENAAPYVDRAKQGNVVVVPDVRFSGVYDLAGLAGLIGPDLVHYDIANNASAYNDPADQRSFLLWAWERNSVVWGRPLVGMATTDILNILAALANDPRADTGSVRIETRGVSHLGLAAVFAAVLDARIQSLDVDLGKSRYDTYRYWREAPDALPVIPFILRYGDVPQWLAVLADRDVSVRNLDANGNELAWLKRCFAATGNPAGLRIDGME
ncbi:MAG: hypothetical protein GXX88_01135 [Candidatus Hydrogenedentes bacterium]|nr:hypothetical protein [Candidatus Hydrogenedentota bacterium]